MIRYFYYLLWNRVINYWRARVAGMELKYKKLMKSVDDAAKQVSEKKELMVRRLYPDQDIDNVAAEQLINMVAEANKTDIVKKAKAKYNKLLQKTKEYEDTNDKLEDYENLLEEFMRKIKIKNLPKTNFARE